MEEISSATDISTSLSEFVRKEKLLKELYQDGIKTVKPLAFEKLKYNDEEIDGILQQMGRLLSPEGEEVDNSVYKHVMEETENKSIEQILHEAKELVRESTPLGETSSFCLSTDDLSSECTENDTAFIVIKNGNENYDVNRNLDYGHSNRPANSKNINGNYPAGNKYTDLKKKSLGLFQTFTSKKNKNEPENGDVQALKNEITRFSQLYNACKEESNTLRKEVANLQVKFNLS